MTPNKKLLENQSACKKHASLVAQNDVREFLDMALLEMVQQQTELVEDKPEAVAYRMQGARRFIDIFLSLSTTPTKPRYTDQLNLPKDD
jgi:hypothetical protein